MFPLKLSVWDELGDFDLFSFQFCWLNLDWILKLFGDFLAPPNIKDIIEFDRIPII